MTDENDVLTFVAVSLLVFVHSGWPEIRFGYKICWSSWEITKRYHYSALWLSLSPGWRDLNNPGLECTLSVSQCLRITVWKTSSKCRKTEGQRRIQGDVGAPLHWP